MRISEWRIEWEPTGGSPLVLLDFDDTMLGEISIGGQQLADSAPLDFVVDAAIAARGNARDNLSFSRLVPHGTTAGSWEAVHSALRSTPWGAKSLLSIKPRNGPAWFYHAAVTTSAHATRSDGELPESDHRYAFRVVSLSALLLPGGIVIIGGTFNPPAEYTVPQLPPGVSIPPGTSVIISGTPGMVSGGYTVTGPGLGSGGSGDIGIEPDLPEPIELVSPPSIASANRYPGTAVTATPASWLNATTFDRQWYFNGSATGVTSTTWAIPSDAEEGDTIFWRETATNTLGSENSQSNTITVEELPFENLEPPIISGPGEPGGTLTVTPGEWQSEDSVSGEWFYNDTPTGSVGTTFEIPDEAEEDDEVFYRETAEKAGHADLTASSNIITISTIPEGSPIGVNSFYTPATGILELDVNNGFAFVVGNDAYTVGLPRVADGPHEVLAIEGSGIFITHITLSVASHPTVASSPFTVPDFAGAYNFGEMTNGAFKVGFAISVHASGLNDGATYQARMYHEGSAVTVSLTPAGGIAEASLGTGYSARSVTQTPFNTPIYPAENPYPNPLPLNGGETNYPITDSLANERNLYISAPSAIQIQLLRNGTVVDSIFWIPNWESEIVYGSAGTTPVMSVDSGVSEAIEIVGPGATAADPPEAGTWALETGGLNRGTVAPLP